MLQVSKKDARPCSESNTEATPMRDSRDMLGGPSEECRSWFSFMELTLALDTVSSSLLKTIFTPRAPKDNPKDMGHVINSVKHTDIDTHVYTKETTKPITATNFWCKTNWNKGWQFRMKYLEENIYSFFYRSTLNPSLFLVPCPSSNNHPHLLNGSSSSLQNHSTCMVSQIHLGQSIRISGGFFLFFEDRYRKMFSVNTEGASK